MDTADSTVLWALTGGQLHRFADWPVRDVPAVAAGVYTVWHDQTLVYVGMSGRGRSKEHLETAAIVGTKRVGLFTRLSSHASGRRSGDQFCVYVCDRLVLSTLTRQQIDAIAAGRLSLDQLTKSFIHDQLGFRFTTTADGTSALSLEAQCRAGVLGSTPLLNPMPVLRR